MSETLNARQKHLLTLLVRSSAYVPLAQLVAASNCSAKTVYRDMQKLSQMESVYGFHVQKCGRQGFRIEADDEVKAQLDFELKSNRLTLTGESVMQRRYRIYLDLLMYAPTPTTIQKLSEQYYVGKSSVVNDLAWIEALAKDAGLSMRRTHNGTWILGEERQIRNEIAGLMKSIRFSAVSGDTPELNRIDAETAQILKQTYGEREVGLVAHAIEAIEVRLGRMMGDIYYINVLTHTLIASRRIASGQYIEAENVMPCREADNEAYHVIEFEMRKLGAFLGITYPEEELLFLYTHFTSAGYGEMPAEERLASALGQIPQKTRDFCRELIQGIEAQAHVSIPKERHVLDSLILHVNSMMNRIQYDIRISCPLKEQIIRTFSDTYLLVRGELLRMKKKYFPDCYISEDEICYLCLYFQLFLETGKRKHRILVVCSTGVGTSHLLRKRIEGAFPELEIADVLSVKRLMQYDLRGIDFVVSSVKLRCALPVPVVNVSILMDHADSMAISDAVFQSKRKETNTMHIRSVLSAENIKLALRGKTKAEVLREMSELLFQNGHITDVDAFVAELQLREAEGITGIGEGVAIPHGKSPVVTKTVVAVGRSRDGIAWESFDDKPVHVVILFAVRDVDRSQHVMLLSRIAELLCDKDVPNALLVAEGCEEIIQILGKEGA